MAFVVEDGTGLPDSNAYIEVAFADGYFADRNNAEWAALTTEQKEVAIISATDYIDFRWGSKFKSYPSVEGQALEFPREAWLGIPTGVKKACAEYAVRASKFTLAPDIEQDPSGYQISRKMESIGPISERTDFAFLGPGAQRKLFKPYPAADYLLLPYMRNGAAGGGVIRNG